ncbi:uncharacterized protein LOC121049641 [Rosa chinensis]|uniref:uncharacterized protein LOC121049641 n=1 Tax=Rosa chinensis TaxID=74649 RepID=UPI001AD8BCE8|nr:uncharacterized protein LOC121049641 [Rosa chinensis]
MSIMSSLFFTLLCFSSMHANSEARYIGLGRSHRGFRALFPHSDKGQFLVVEKLRLGIDWSTKGSVLVKQDDDLAGEQKGNHGRVVSSSSSSSTTTTTTKGKLEYAGSEIFESSSSTSAHMGLHKDKATTTVTKESRRRGLYAKERQTNKVEDDDDGVVLDDYKPPHQTPPIHNRRT